MAAPAYRQYAAQPAIPERRRRGLNKTSVHIVRGDRPATLPKAPSNIAIVAAFVAALLVVFTLLSFARVAISSATIAIAIESQDLSSQIETDRAAGNKLEVSESLLTNSSNIKANATKLGMAASYSSEVITLEQDIVAMNASGDLSLTESFRRASAAVQG